MVKAVSSVLDTSEDANKTVAADLYDLMQNDRHFQESNILAEEIQTVGYMNANRSSMTMFSSVEAVRVEAEKAMAAMSHANAIASAAYQTAKQAKQSRAALQQAMKSYREEQERENIRIRKEQEAKAKKDEKQKQKSADKAARAEENLAKKKRKAEEKEQQDQENSGNKGKSGGATNRRRGKGTDELVESDFPVLLTRFPERDVPVVDSLEAFVQSILLGMPVIWRYRRSPMKKVLEFHEEHDAKTAMNGAAVLKADCRDFMARFAEQCQQDDKLIRRPVPPSEHAVAHGQALSLELHLQLAVDTENQKPLEQSHPEHRPFAVMERSMIETEFEIALRDMSTKDDAVYESAEAEQKLFREMHLLGFQHGKSISGCMHGMFPHLIYQMEGTRAAAFVSLDDVSCPVKSLAAFASW